MISRSNVVKMFFLTFVLILFIACARAQSPAPAVSFAKASANPCLRYQPRDFWMVGHLDCRAYFQFANSSQSGNPAMGLALNQYIQAIEGMVGINLQTDVQYAMFYVAGNPETDLRALSVIKGSFDNSAVNMRLGFTAGLLMKAVDYNGMTIYENEGAGYCFPESSTILAGDSGLIRQSLDGIKIKGSRLPKNLERLLDKTNGASIGWAAAKPASFMQIDYIRSFKEAQPAFAQRLSGQDFISVSFEQASDGATARALTFFSDTAKAKNFHEYLENWRKSILKKEGANIFFCSFLISSETSVEGTFVRWNLHLTRKALSDLMKTKVVLVPSE